MGAAVKSLEVSSCSSRGSPCTLPMKGSPGPGALTQGSWATSAKATRRDAQMWRCRLPSPRQGWCVQMSLNLTLILIAGGCVQGSRALCKILGGGHSSTFRRFSQPHAEATFREQFSSRLCLQLWVTGKVTHIPAAMVQPQLWAFPGQPQSCTVGPASPLGNAHSCPHPEVRPGGRSPALRSRPSDLLDRDHGPSPCWSSVAPCVK